MTDNVHKETAKSIAREIENDARHGHGHQFHSAFQHELHKLRDLDTHNGHLNLHKYKHDLHTVERQLHADGYLPHLHIVMDKAHNAHLVHDHKGNPSAESPQIAPPKDGQPRPPHVTGHDSALNSERPRHGTTNGAPLPLDGSPHKRSPANGLLDTAPAPAPIYDNSRNPIGDTSRIPSGDNTRIPTGDNIPTPTGDNTPTPIGDIPVGPLDAPQRNDGTTSTGGLAALQQAIKRANSGGDPVRVLQYGDSHIAAGTEPKTIQSLMSGLAPVDYATKAKVSISATYPLANPQSWLDQPIAQSKPDLVILSFGSNDAAGPVNKEAYERNYQKLIDGIKQRAPNASIMIVGPTDGESITGANKGRPLPGLDTVVEAQREVAAKNGLDFFDVRAAMGGAGSIEQWRAQGLAAGDKLHFSAKGYQIIGQDIFNHMKQQLG